MVSMFADIADDERQRVACATREERSVLVNCMGKAANVEKLLGKAS